MTCILVTPTWIAADMAVSEGPYMTATHDKLVRIGDSIIGCAGSVSDILKYRRWLQGNRDFVETGYTDSIYDGPGELEALVLNKHYKVSHVFGGVIMTSTSGLTEDHIACGAGSVVGTALFRAGLSDPKQIAAIIADTTHGIGRKWNTYRIEGRDFVYEYFTV